MVRLIINQKGISMIEILIVVVIVGFLATMGIPGYLELKKNSYQQSGMAQLAAYHRSAKIMMGEFAYNPGNFAAIGFKLEGDYYYRIVADDHTNPPDYYPNQDSCISTERPALNVIGGCSVLCGEANSKCSDVDNYPWRELLTASSYKTGHKTPAVNDMTFKVYAFSNDEQNYLCTDERGVYAGDCP